MSRMLILVGLLATLSGCSSDGTGTDENVTVRFRIDAQTCNGSGTVAFFIDGATVGTETMSAGATSKEYTTTRTVHVLGARDLGSGFTWGPANVDLSPHSAFTQVLTC